jgi:hypothetical protein
MHTLHNRGTKTLRVEGVGYDVIGHPKRYIKDVARIRVKKFYILYIF